MRADEKAMRTVWGGPRSFCYVSRYSSVLREVESSLNRNVGFEELYSVAKISFSPLLSMSSDGHAKRKAGDYGGTPSKSRIILLILCTNLASVFLFSGPFHWMLVQYLHADYDSNHSSSAYSMHGNGELIAQLNQTRHELQLSKELSEELTAQIAHLTQFLRSSFQEPNGSANGDDADDPWLPWGGEANRGALPAELKEFITPKKLPLGNNPSFGSDTIFSSVGQACALLKDDIEEYMDYKPGEFCPDDEVLAQKLMLRGCEPLPRRRCIPRSSPNYQEPFPFPQSMWTTPPNSSVVWTAYTCKDYACLIDRKNHPGFDDCKDCFDLQHREMTRWLQGGGLDYSIDEILALKKGTIRIGLDIGGGTATFAVRMRERNVTIVTTSMNFNGPFNNFIASRGVVPLYITINHRLPFFDNTLDLVHSMHVLSNWIPNQLLEFVLYDIYRVLRPGGVFWLDHFFCLGDQLETYLPMIENLGFNKIKWSIGRKMDRGPQFKEMYISALLEKPLERQR